MRKVFERYTCSVCGAVADSVCPGSPGSPPAPLPEHWLVVTFEVRISGRTGSSQGDPLVNSDGWLHACSTKCAVSLLTKAVSRVTES